MDHNYSVYPKDNAAIYRIRTILNSKGYRQQWKNNYGISYRKESGNNLFYVYVSMRKSNKV